MTNAIKASAARYGCNPILAGRNQVVTRSHENLRITQRSGILTQQGNRTMTKNLALAASIMMLVAISGQAFAGTAAPNARYWPKAIAPSDRQAVSAYNAYDRAVATETVEPNAHRYYGGPKSNY
ncbi:hypothetical protein [Bradyrhizobium erythrophlei]|jgi:hypothetical protein|nr:hypothetical protein [Bradyrhizobium erythrophlei]